MLAPGADADLAIVDLNPEKTVTASMLEGYADFSLYEGQVVKGWPTLTLVRGEVVMRDGEIVGKPGDGRYEQK